jgi:hypothetical protein
MENKEFVGMADCFLCGKPKYLLLDKRLRKSLPRSAVYDKEPCDDCKKLMEQGIIFIGVRDNENHDNPYRTGQWFVLKEQAVKEMPMGEELRQSILKKRVCFIEVTVMKKLGLLEMVEAKAKEQK